MSEMSRKFLMAYGLSKFHKDEAIRLYEEEVIVNPENLAAWGNMGLCKLELAIERNDKAL